MNKIRALRKIHGMTMKELGNLVGLSESTISLYENGKREPDLETLQHFADIFHVSVDYILGRDVAESNPPTDSVESQRDEAIRILKSLSDENYQAMLTILRTMVDKKK